MFSTLGRVVYQRHRTILVIWALVAVLGAVLGAGIADRLTSENTGSDRLESTRVAQRLDEIAGTGGEIVAIVDGVDVDDDTIRTEVDAARTDIAALDGVASVIDHYSTGAPALRSLDDTASLIVVTVDAHLPADTEQDLVHDVTERLHEIDAPQITVGGTLVMYEEFQHAAEKDLQRGEMIALPIALAAMVIIFGGLIAAGLPIAVAFAGVLGSMIVLTAATAMTDVSIFALNVVTMLGLGLGIDYGLLVVSRFREERGAGRSIQAAVERTVATAGRTVAFSAMTVAAALIGLFVFAEPTLTSFGIAGIGVVVISLLAGTTLLPAILAVAGRRIKPARPATGEHGAFHQLARFVQRRALPIVAIVGVVLVALATPFLGARFESGDARSLPRSAEAREVALTLADRFPARGADPVVVVADAPQTDPAVAALVDTIDQLSGVAGVTVRPGDAAVTVIDAVPAGTSQGAEAQDLVHAIRSLDAPVDVEVGGTAAYLIDFKDSVAERLPWALALIIVATFVLLFLMTGSIAVPLKAILMNLLSLGASFGALVWIFQDGHLSGLLGFEPVGSIDLFMPILVFIFAFGLSMDYEVFLISRIKEIHDETGDNDTAVSVGLQRTGRIITSAALLIVVVFAGFAAGEVLTIKQLGVGLAIAVIVDATIVRSLLVPATMKLLGEWNWWAPAPLRRIHERFGLHETTLDEPTDGSVPSADASLARSDELELV